MKPTDSALDALAAAVRDARHELVLVTTGAGISLASGIPTFRGTDPDADEPNPLGEAVYALMTRIGLPTRLVDVGYREDDVPDLVAGAEKQQRLLACAPLPVGADLLGRVFRESM